LFDAVAALLGIRQTVRFEGQAAMELEFATAGIQTDESYAFELLRNETPLPDLLHQVHPVHIEPPPNEAPLPAPPLVVDWSPILKGILSDLKTGLPVALISAKFHNALAEVIVAVARQAGQTQVALSGGCFQNRYLTERAASRLACEGFRPYWHQRIPPNDGGIALGQIIATLMRQ